MNWGFGVALNFNSSAQLGTRKPPRVRSGVQPPCSPSCLSNDANFSSQCFSSLLLGQSKPCIAQPTVVWKQSTPPPPKPMTRPRGRGFPCHADGRLAAVPAAGPPPARPQRGPDAAGTRRSLPLPPPWSTPLRQAEVWNKLPGGGCGQLLFLLDECFGERRGAPAGTGVTSP